MGKIRESFIGALLFIGSTLLIIAFCEIFIRIALFSDTFQITQLRQAWRFADYAHEDDYWKLAVLFKSNSQGIRAGYVDSQLGWAPKPTRDNPLGIHSEKPYDLNTIVRPILFFGDSYVAGVTPMGERIPQLLDKLNLKRPVLNMGVSGYGLDQIYLRFRKTVSEFEQPSILVGVLTHDLDRSILGIRTFQKPYFDVEDDILTTRNLPILENPLDYIEKNPVKIRSYFARFVMFRVRPLLPEGWFNHLFGYDKTHERKKKINHRILQAFKEDARAFNMPILVVIFYSIEEIRGQVTWRENFLKDVLNELDIPYFDTKAYLREIMTKQGISAEELFYTENNHLNVKGNNLVAQGIYSMLESERLF